MKSYDNKIKEFNHDFNEHISIFDVWRMQFVELCFSLAQNPQAATNIVFLFFFLVFFTTILWQLAKFWNGSNPYEICYLPKTPKLTSFISSNFDFVSRLNNFLIFGSFMSIILEFFRYMCDFFFVLLSLQWA